MLFRLFPHCIIRHSAVQLLLLLFSLAAFCWPFLSIFRRHLHFLGLTLDNIPSMLGSSSFSATFPSKLHLYTNSVSDFIIIKIILIFNINTNSVDLILFINQFHQRKSYVTLYIEPAHIIGVL